MNVSHARVTDWGLTHVSIAPDDVVLDIGCGGGRTIGKLAAMATRGRVYGVDHSTESVDASRSRNARDVASGRVDIRVASVSALPFPDATFDVVTAVETHIWWPDLPRDVQEVRRVLKPGGRFVVISEVYRGAEAVVSRLAAQHADRIGMTLLDVDQHQRLLAEAGYADIEIDAVSSKAWICVVGRRPTTR
jgi:ubiquinone/menaquinone biosynthesis C-methylase UbiE